MPQSFQAMATSHPWTRGESPGESPGVRSSAGSSSSSWSMFFPKMYMRFPAWKSTPGAGSIFVKWGAISGWYREDENGDFMVTWWYSSSTAQGGGGSFKNRKPIGETGCCKSGMAERSHWWTERWLRSPLFPSLSLTIYLPTYLSSMYLSIDLSISLSLFHLSICLICLAVYLSIYLSICLPV